MLEEPALLTIKRPGRRPTEAQIAAFQGVATSFVVDAMQGGGALDPAIRPIGEARDMPCQAAGPALTVDPGPADILATLAAITEVQQGDMIMIAADGHRACASTGDRVCGFFKNAGAAGLVTDGMVRDYAGIVEVGLPVWCAGLNPNTPFGNGPGKVGTPVVVAGQPVETGDMVVADFDGVVVVPFDRLDEVIAKLKTVIELETEMDQKVRDGLTVPPSVEALLATDKVAYID